MEVTATIDTGKAARKTYALFYAGAEEPELIGKGIEELSIEQGADVTTTKDVTGSTDVSVNSYEKTTDLDPIYVTGGNKFSEFLDEAEEYEKTGDDVVKPFIHVKAYKKTADGKYAAWRQKAAVEIKSFGGDVSGVQCPATLHWLGEREHGTFDPDTKTFTPNTAAG